MIMNMKTIDMVTRPPFILVMAVISVVGTIIYLGNTLAEDNNTDRRAVLPYTQTQTFHLGHSVSSYDAQLEAFPIRNVEHFNSIDRAGDAEIQPASLKVSSDSMTPDGNCEHCELITYTPGPQGWAGIAFKSNRLLDLSAAGRIIFFAKGNMGGENVAFVGVGKNVSGTGSQVSNFSLTHTHTFKNLRFAVTSQNISLTSEWKRYELNVDGRNMTSISYPFGFIVMKGKNQAISPIQRLSLDESLQQVGNLNGAIPTDNTPNRVIFFLKGVTIDPYPALINPLPTIK
jgi:hypothetical protein